MVSREVEGFFYAKITFKLRESPYTETTRWFGTATYGEGEAYSTQTDHIQGLIRAIGGIGQTTDAAIPSVRTGAITLDNTRGNTGRYTRFSDYLDREDVIEQNIEIHAFRKPVDSPGTFATGNTQIFAGQVKSIDVAVASGLITLNLEADGITREVLQTEVTPSLFSTAPAKSQHKYLPLVFGLKEVRPVIRTEATVSGGDTQNQYLYATTGGTQYPSGGVNAFLTKNLEGDYVALTHSGKDTAFHGDLTDDNDGVTLGANLFAHKISGFTGNHYLSNLSVALSTTGAFDGVVNVVIYEKHPSLDAPGNVVATVAFTDLSAGSVQDVRGVLDKPFVMEEGKEYFYSLGAVNITVGSVDIRRLDSESGDVADQWSLSADETGPGGIGWKKASVGYYPFKVAFYSTTFADSTSNSNNFAFCSLTVGADISETNFAKLDVILEVNGLKDDTSGTLTGTVSKPLDTAADAIRYIQRNKGNFDDTTLTPDTVLETLEPRDINGASRGRQTAASMLQDIVTQSACKLVPYSDGTIVLWCYGLNQTRKALITEESARLISWQSIRGTIVNDVQVAYKKSAVPLDLEDLSTDFQPNNYEKVLSWNNSTGAPQTGWTNDSVNLYGTQSLNNRVVELDWIDDDGAAQTFAKYALQGFTKPKWVFDIEVPYFESNYDEIEVMDIVELEHNDSPSHTGTSYDEDKWPVDAGLENKRVTNGFIWRMAQKYKCRVIAKRLSLQLGTPKGAQLQLTLEILNQPFEIT